MFIISITPLAIITMVKPRAGQEGSEFVNEFKNVAHQIVSFMENFEILAKQLFDGLERLEVSAIYETLVQTDLLSKKRSSVV